MLPLRRRSRISSTSSDPIPLSTLREVVDDSSGQSHWTLEISGLDDRALLQPAGSRFTYELANDRPLTLEGRVALVPEDWRDGTGSVLAQVDAATQRGWITVWRETLLPARGRGDVDGIPLRGEIPEDTAAVTLIVRQGSTPDGHAVGRVLWIAPTLRDPSAPPSMRAPSPGGTQDRPDRPLISVVTPVHDPPLAMLHECVASVQAQTYTNWEMVLVDDGSRDPAVIEALNDYEAADPRIRLHRNPEAGGISRATNTALDLARGEYVALLDHDDTIDHTALEKIAARISAEPTVDMVYTDEMIVPLRGRPILMHKPGWSREQFESMMYTCHLGVYRRALVQEIGGFDPSFDGCQDYDLVLRLIERTDRVAHVPEILYHWRAHAASTAASEIAKPYAYTRQVAALRAHLRRTGRADVEVRHVQQPGKHLIVHDVDPDASVDVIVADSDISAISQVATSLLNQPHPSWRLLVAIPSEQHDDARATLDELGVPPERLVLVNAHGNTADRLSIGTRTSTGEFLLLVAAPFLALTADWLRRLIGYAGQPGVAASGPILLGESGRIRSAGVAMPDGLPLYLLHGLDSSAAMHVATNTVAVDGVVMTSAATFNAIGGVHPDAAELMLVEYCVRAYRDGMRAVVVPDVRLRCERPAPANYLAGLLGLRRAWRARQTRDDHFPGAFHTDHGDLRPRAATRV